MTEKVRTVARYLRVSTTDQNPRLQADETAAFIERRGWTLAETYLDHGISGAKDSRPELDRMLADARKGRFNILLVWKADRLCRSLRHLVNTLAELSALGIDFVSATEPWDTSTPQGTFTAHIIGAMAQYERSLTMERSRAGIAAARLRGATFGRPRIQIDVQRFLTLRAEGKSLRAVARELRVGVATLHRLAKKVEAGGGVPKV